MASIRINYCLSLAFGIILLSGCSTKEILEPIESTEQAYYTGAKKALKSGNYISAVEKLEELESRYPFGHYAEQAQLDLIYAHYKSFDHEAARAAADRFIRLHPQHDELDYAYYMRGLASFAQDQGILDRFLPTDLTKRDPGAARESIADFALLLSRFPDSQYADDAQARLIYLRNLLAAYEIHVARYYIKRQAFIAASNRGRYVIEHFQQTPAVPDGLAVMVESYRQLGLDQLADQTLSILSMNYPDYPALGKDGSFDIARSSVGTKGSLLNRVTFGLLGKADIN